MRRMYTEKQLTEIIHEVVGEYIEEGALDESIADAVDAYLLEHPVDITALEGQNISLATLTSTGDVDVGGDLDVTGSIGGAEIVEKMSGFTFSTVNTDSYVSLTYAGVVKNGNKLTFAVAGSVKNPSKYSTTLGDFYFPQSIANKLIPYEDAALAVGTIFMVNGTFGNGVGKYFGFNKKIPPASPGATPMIYGLNAGLEVDTNYFFRLEVTFLLSENLAS